MVLARKSLVARRDPNPAVRAVRDLNLVVSPDASLVVSLVVSLAARAARAPQCSITKIA